MRFCRLGAIVGLFFWSSAAFAQALTLDFGESGGSLTERVFLLIALLTVLSIAPSLLIMATSFTRIVIVLSLLRSALGTQNAPPNNVLTGLALFLTVFIMTPTFLQSYEQGIAPLIEGRIDQKEAFTPIIAPFRTFMLKNTREEDVQLFLDLAKVAPPDVAAEISLQTLIPAFMISELRRAFEIGFLVFLPFLVIDLIVSSLLISMGMMMLPPIVISLPFKLIFFVLVDGWGLISGGLVQSFVL